MVKFLDTVLDVSDYPYEELRDRAISDRRIGLNPISGLGSALAMLCIPYDSQIAKNFTNIIGAYALNVAYSASIELAKERGVFPNYDRDKFLQSNFVKEKVSGHLRKEIFNHGIRNIAILTVPPVGTGSLLVGNISNGLEPIFSLEYNRKIRQTNGSFNIEPVEDYAWKLYKNISTPNGTKIQDYIIPDFFKTSKEISPKVHIDMQAIVQQYIDGAISKTCNMPNSFTLEEYEELLLYAISSGCKGK